MALLQIRMPDYRHHACNVYYTCDFVRRRISAVQGPEMNLEKAPSIITSPVLMSKEKAIEFP